MKQSETYLGEKEEKKEDKEPEDFDRITLQEFKYPILHKYYDTYKNNFFLIDKKLNNNKK